MKTVGQAFWRTGRSRVRDRLTLALPSLGEMLSQTQATTSLPSAFGAAMVISGLFGFGMVRWRYHCELSQTAPSVAPVSAPIRIVLAVLQAPASFLRSRNA